MVSEEVPELVRVQWQPLGEKVHLTAQDQTENVPSRLTHLKQESATKSRGAGLKKRTCHEELRGRLHENGGNKQIRRDC